MVKISKMIIDRGSALTPIFLKVKKKKVKPAIDDKDWIEKK